MTYVRLFVCGVLLLPVLALATATTVTFPEAYEPYVLAHDVRERTTYLSTLETEPHTYEFVLPAGETIVMRVLQRPVADPLPLSLLLIEMLPEGQGVREVVRQHTTAGEWLVEKSAVGFVPVLASAELEVALPAGRYRLEVSTPDNLGAYALELGSEATARSWREQFADASKFQQHFDYGALQSLKIPIVYWTICLLVLAVVLQRAWRWRRYL